MHRFKVGQKVVALVNRRSTLGTVSIEKGREYTVIGLTCCQSCGKPEVIIKGQNAKVMCECGKCKHESPRTASFNQDHFAPLQNNADAIEYKLKVSIPELTEIKELQNQ